MRRNPAKPHHVLIVDGDVTFRAALMAFLSSESEFTTDEAASLAEAEQKLLNSSAASYDAILIASDLPDGAGADLCAGLRRIGFVKPIFLLSASSKKEAIVAGLDSGANDYIVKPIRASVLLARLLAQLRINTDQKPPRTPTQKAIRAS
jgi:DNA-binding response OmpR family regulator